MPKPLYLHLVNGRCIHVTDTWDGLEPTEEGMVDGSGVIEGTDGKEVSDPYRDIFRSSLKGLNSTGGVNFSEEGVLPGVGAITNGFSGSPVQATATMTVASLSDEAGHVKPRQYYKVYTWLVFEDAENTPFKFRKASISGWSSKPPID